MKWIALVFSLSLSLSPTPCVPKGHTSLQSQVCFGSKKISILLTHIHSSELHFKWMHQRYLKRRKHLPYLENMTSQRVINTGPLCPIMKLAITALRAEKHLTATTGPDQTAQHFTLWWFAKPHVKVHYLAPTVDRHRIIWTMAKSNVKMSK